MPWLRNNISLWNASFSHTSHRVGRQFKVFCHSCCCYCFCCHCCWSKVCGFTVVVCRTGFWVLSLVFFVCQLSALSFVKSWFVTVVACWFGFFRLRFSGILTHCVYLQLIRGFQMVQLQLSFQVWDNHVMCTVFLIALFLNIKMLSLSVRIVFGTRYILHTHVIFQKFCNRFLFRVS